MDNRQFMKRKAFLIAEV